MDNLQNQPLRIEHEGKTVFEGTVGDLERVPHPGPDEGSTTESVESKLLPADDSVLEIARQLIDRHHGELVEARIAYLFRAGDWYSGDKAVFGDAYKVGDRAKAAGYGYDFEVVVNRDVWREAIPETRRAIMDHLLSHCRRAVDAEGGYVSNDDGSPRWRKAPHDFGDFFGVIRRNGTAWHEDLVKLNLIITQPELPGLEKVAEE